MSLLSSFSGSPGGRGEASSALHQDGLVSSEGLHNQAVPPSEQELVLASRRPPCLSEARGAPIIRSPNARHVLYEKISRLSFILCRTVSTVPSPIPLFHIK